MGVEFTQSGNDIITDYDEEDFEESADWLEELEDEMHDDEMGEANSMWPDYDAN